MALSTEQKAQIVKEHQLSATDTGSTQVQVALLTAEINQLNEHLSVHTHDFHSKRGLLIKVGKRRNLLKYLKNEDASAYAALIKKLGLRR